MLIEASFKTNTKSKYRCDRCKKIINARERHVIHHQGYNENPKKFCDFCEECMKAFERAKRKWESK